MKTVEMLRSEIELKRLELKNLKKELSAMTPFEQTKVGQVYYASLAGMSRPFVALHEFAKKKQVQQSNEKIESLLQSARKISSFEDPNAGEMVQKLAQTYLLLAETEANFADNLYVEMRRLRSPEENKRADLLKQKLLEEASD